MNINHHLHDIFLIKNSPAYIQATGRSKIKMDTFLELLSQPVVDLQQLRALCYQGIPDQLPGLRVICWKLLLQVLPIETSKWENQLIQNQQDYLQFIQEFIIKLKDSENQSLDPNLKTWEVIEKDAYRTHMELSFFVNPPKYKNDLPYLMNTLLSKERIRLNDQIQKNYDALTRILFIYACLNPVVKYIQGMNELLAPIYFVFSQDIIAEQSIQAECDAFFAFTYLMSEAKDCFIKKFDKDEFGLKWSIEKFNKYIFKIDRELFDHLNQLEIIPEYYAMKWIMLYLSQDYDMMNLLYIWDRLLTFKQKSIYINALCISILQIKRNELISSEYIKCMQCLSKIEIEVNELLEKAHEMKEIVQSIENEKF